MKDNKLPVGRVPAALPWLPVCPASAASRHLACASPWGQPETVPCLQTTRSSPAPRHGWVTGMVSLGAMGTSCPVPWLRPPRCPPRQGCRPQGSRRQGVGGSGSPPNPGAGGQQGREGGWASTLPPQSFCSKSPSNIYIIYNSKHTDRMTNSCPEASNARHLDKYNSELIGKAWLGDRSQPPTPLQPSPPPPAPRHPLQTGAQPRPKGRVRPDPLSPWQPPHGAYTHTAVTSPVRTRSCPQVP